MSRKLHVKESSSTPLDKKLRRLSPKEFLKELKRVLPTLGDDKDAEELAEYYLREIDASQRRMRKMLKQIDRTDKKIQAILDKLP